MTVKKLKLKFKIGSSTCFQMKPQKHFVTQNFQSNISSKFTRNKNLCFSNSKYVQHVPTFLMLGKKEKIEINCICTKRSITQKEVLINTVIAFFSGWLRKQIVHIKIVKKWFMVQKLIEISW
jgi:hypothetical protein